MMLRYSFGMVDAADSIDAAVEKVLDDGYRTADIFHGREGEKKVGTAEIGAAIIANMS